MKFIALVFSMLAVMSSCGVQTSTSELTNSPMNAPQPAIITSFVAKTPNNHSRLGSQAGLIKVSFKAGNNACKAKAAQFDLQQVESEGDIHVVLKVTRIPNACPINDAPVFKELSIAIAAPKQGHGKVFVDNVTAFGKSEQAFTY